MLRLKILFSCFFIAILFLMAMGETILNGRETFGIEALVLPMELENKEEEYSKPNAQTTCPKEKRFTENQTEPENTKLLKKEPTAENLSFNFIYYVLYKFKYIDIFELVRPSK